MHEGAIAGFLDRSQFTEENVLSLAVGRAVSGTDGGFVWEMNTLVAKLGLRDTHFANPHGLGNTNHYTSAYDLAALARYAMSVEGFAPLSTTRSWTASGSLTTLDVDLSGDEAVVRGTLEAHGANAVFFRQSLEDPERRDEALESQLADEFPGAKLASARYQDLSELEKPSRIEFVLQGGELLRTDGSREFVLPMGRPKNLLDAYASRSKRSQDLVIRVPFSNQTEVRYRLPGTRKFVDTPRDTKLESKFGSLDIQYRRDGRDLLVDVKYSIDVPLVKVEDYQDFRQFLAAVTAAMNESVRVVPAQ